MPTISSSEESFLAALQNGLPPLLPEFLLRQRWFGGKARTIRSVEVSDIVPFHFATLRSYFILARVTYTAGAAETYDIPLVHVPSQSGSDSPQLRLQSHNLAEEVDTHGRGDRPAIPDSPPRCNCERCVLNWNERPDSGGSHGGTSVPVAALAKPTYALGDERRAEQQLRDL